MGQKRYNIFITNIINFYKIHNAIIKKLIIFNLLLVAIDFSVCFYFKNVVWFFIFNTIKKIKNISDNIGINLFFILSVRTFYIVHFKKLFYGGDTNVQYIIIKHI